LLVGFKPETYAGEVKRTPARKAQSSSIR
jgi:hypothetical protein